jgi:LCP family protein required for cell wall assembly
LSLGQARASVDAQADKPNPMPLADKRGQDIANYLLLGSDTSKTVDAGRTDVMLVVSVNRTAGTVSMLSIPRDLYVYIPGWQMERINTAFGHGEHDGEGGAKLLADTIQYNLGLTIDHFARVDFNGFKQIVDDIGGVQLSVDCAIQDWKLKQDDLDPNVEDNWEWFTLPVGVHNFNGYLALWYVRSRHTSSDFDRGRRQQAMLRALWGRIRALGLTNQIAELWPQITEIVTTDLTAQDLIDLTPLALSLDSSHIASYTFRQNLEVNGWTSPAGASVLLPIRDAIGVLMQKFLTPPTSSQLAQERPTIEIVNASGFSDFTQVAYDRLSVEGFTPVVNPQPAPMQTYNAIFDYTGSTKGTTLSTLKSILRVGDAGIVIQPNANRATDFRVVIGSAYKSCTYGVLPPKPLYNTDDGESLAAP